MRRLFRFFAMFLICVSPFYLLPSCTVPPTKLQLSEQDTDTTKTFLSGPIIIIGGDTSTGELYFKRNIGHVIVTSRSGIINWQLQGGSMVQSLDTIAIDSLVN